MSNTAETINQEASKPLSLFKEVTQALTNLIMPTQHDLITLIRTPTPIKFSKTFQVGADGTIGGGIANPNWQELYRCPVSTEAWLHRISIWSPSYPPAAPLQTGQILCTGSTAGEIIFWLPQAGSVCPIQIVEGRLSAPHLNSGEVAQIVGDTLPAGITIRIDLQLIRTTGISQDTPRRQSPTDLEQAEPPIIG